jgi:hypothetical protein
MNVAIDPKVIDKLVGDCKKPEQIQSLLKQLTKSVLERAMQAEMTEHLGYEKHDPAGYNSGNSRNGKTRKKLKGDFGEIELERRAIEMEASSHRSWARARHDGQVSMTRYFRCMRVACRRGKSKGIWKRCMA